MKNLTVPVLDHPLGWYRSTITKFLQEKHCIPENFFKWMQGQTTGVDTNGETIYYVNDVLNYLENGGLNAKITD